MKRILLLSATLFITAFSMAQTSASVEKQTYLYSVKGNDSLYLDRYEISGVDSLPKPAIIFMFGGGFFAGTRDRESYTPFFNYMAEQGYSVVSIDYRLGLKDAGEEKNLNPLGFIRLLSNTINMAVEDLYDATNFVLKNSQDWNVSQDEIIACGSSAGAIGVLQGEYEIVSGGKIARKLPEGFNYAGVISFAGAIFVQGKIKGESMPCPILMFHGDGDRNVPYDSLTERGLGFYGSKHLAGELKQNDCPYWFYSVTNASHEISDSPMNNNREEIVSFLNKYVHQGQSLTTETTVRQIGKPDIKKNFELLDYVKTNFGI